MNVATEKKVKEQMESYLFEDDLALVDPEIKRLMDLEDERQLRKIILIASESVAPRAVRQALDSSFTNLYAEGYPSTRMIRSKERPLLNFDHHLSFFRRYYDRRYYKGCDYINFVESLCHQRARELFATDRYSGPGPKVKAEEIFVNAQALSGAAANNAIYEAFLNPDDMVMGMALNSGGHLTHGSPVNRSGKRYKVVSYTANRGTGKLDFSEIRKIALEHKPKMIIAGYSAYPWAIDWAAFKEIAEELKNGCILLADISHPSGLVVAGQFPSPIGIADVTMTTTHKTLCGPRGALILSTDKCKADAIDFTVFPGEQGGPHINSILAQAVAFKLGMTESFQRMQKKIKENALYLSEKMKELGIKLAYGGTDSHLFLLDLKTLKGPHNYSLRGEVASRILDLCGITLNKNTIAGDTNAAHPTAIRIGTTWITQRGFGKTELDRLAELIHKALTEAVPYHYIGPAADLGRAKIEYKVMEEIKAGVQELLDGVKPDLPEGHPLYPHYSMPAAKRFGSALSAELEKAGAEMKERDGRKLPESFEGREAEAAFAGEKAVLADLSQSPLIEISGERAENFLHDVLTLNVRKMTAGESRRAFMLNAEGKLFSSVTVTRFDRDKTGFDRFRLSINSDRGEEVLSWLRGLSDGYILFDLDDVFKKAEGPVVVASLSTSASPEHRRVRLAVLGPKAPEIVAETIPEAASLEEGHFIHVDCGGTAILVARPEGLFGVGGYEIQLHPRQTPGLWNTLLERGKSAIKPIGRAALRVLLKEGVDTTDQPYAPVLLERFPECFDLNKPYFIGRQTLPKSEALPEYEYKPEEKPLKRTPLYEEHLKLGAKKFMAPFAGWEMPVWYTRVSDEHHAVRTTAGLFDVAHMGVFEVTGPNATRFLDLIATNYVVRMVDGQAQYNYLLYPDGTVVDDIMIYKLNSENYQVVCNAANEDKVLDWVHAVNSGEVQIDKDNPGTRIEEPAVVRSLKDPATGKDSRIDIALQGPMSCEILKAMTDDEEIRNRLDALPKSMLMKTELGGIPVIVSRTGYTGEEFGYELFVHPDRAVAFWTAVLEAGKPFGVRPTGLGARDSTRTEAGFPLYGHELAGEFEVDPIEASYGAFVKFHKPFFIGRKPMLERWLKPRKKEIVRFRITTKNPRNIRTGDPVVDRSGRYIGNVTSCALIKKKLRGLALVEKSFASSGSKIAVIPLPPGGKVPAPVEWDKMKKGDRLIINERAIVIPRFPMRS
ncbi:MAG: glycine cleavage system aminomethyltransferase GcvT [Planctomycetota bacterium]|jgi:glycine cleavage system T protein